MPPGLVRLPSRPPLQTAADFDPPRESARFELQSGITGWGVPPSGQCGLPADHVSPPPPEKKKVTCFFVFGTRPKHPQEPPGFPKPFFVLKLSLAEDYAADPIYFVVVVFWRKTVKKRQTAQP